MREYYLGTIVIAIILLYLFTALLSKYKKIEKSTHRKIWNIILLVSFLIMGVFGIILTARVQYGILVPNISRVIFLHVEAGIVMTMVSIFHIIWHLKYYLNIFKSKK